MSWFTCPATQRTVTAVPSYPASLCRTWWAPGKGRAGGGGRQRKVKTPAFSLSISCSRGKKQTPHLFQRPLGDQLAVVAASLLPLLVPIAEILVDLVAPLHPLPLVLMRGTETARKTRGRNEPAKKGWAGRSALDTPTQISPILLRRLKTGAPADGGPWLRSWPTCTWGSE